MSRGEIVIEEDSKTFSGNPRVKTSHIREVWLALHP
jgi:hypothetical protein